MKLPQIDFDPDSHSYKAFGKTQPSVTTILGLANSFEFVDKGLLDRAAKFGTAVHKATQLYDEHNLNIDTLDVALVSYLEGWKKFLSETGFEILECEYKIASKAGYAGTLDRIGYFGEDLTILDIKTGVTAPKTTKLQLSAYAQAFQQMTGRRIKKRLCVILKPYAYKITQYTDESDYLNFLQFLSVHRWINNG
jgi:hypothetical protein